jgi:hypothetical protein
VPVTAQPRWTVKHKETADVTSESGANAGAVVGALEPLHSLLRLCPGGVPG